MKIDTVKTLLAVALAVVLSLICYKMAMEEGSRNWIAFTITFVSTLALLIPAMGIDWSGFSGRGITIKVYAWVVLVIQYATDFVFSLCDFDTVWFLIIVLLELILSAYIIYSVAKPVAPKE